MQKKLQISMPYSASKFCHKCQHWHVTMCYKVKLTLNKAIYESCLSTTFLCLRSERLWLIKAHTIPQAVTGFTLHLYVLNCTACAPGESHCPRKASLPHPQMKRRWWKHQGWAEPAGNKACHPSWFHASRTAAWIHDRHEKSSWGPHFLKQRRHRILIIKAHEPK